MKQTMYNTLMQEQPQDDQFSSNNHPDAGKPSEYPQDSYDQRTVATPLADLIEWDAAEYELQEKNSAWYGALALSAVIMAGIIYLLNRDIFTVIVVLVAFSGIGYMSGRKPRQLHYVVSNEGIQVGGRAYSFSDFRSFHVVEVGNLPSITLMPLKRFMPAISICITSEYFADVTDFISQIIPMEPHKADFVEKLMHRLHF